MQVRLVFARCNNDRAVGGDRRRCVDIAAQRPTAAGHVLQPCAAGQRDRKREHRAIGDAGWIGGVAVNDDPGETTEIVRCAVLQATLTLVMLAPPTVPVPLVTTQD